MPVSYNSPGTALADLRLAWPDRLREANECLQSDRPGTAIALALYALEIYLKVRICERLELDYLPTPFQIHDLKQLLTLCGLAKRMQVPANILVKENWDEINSSAGNGSHVNSLRYKPNASWPISQATELLGRIQDLPNGVLIWPQTQT